MAIGALAQAGLKRKPETAAVAFLSHAALDGPRFWHPYPWPSDFSPPIINVLPYPHHPQSILLDIGLILAFLAMVIMLRQYRWGMLWAISPDLIDWIVLKPITGSGQVHSLFSELSTPWGLTVEFGLVILVLWSLWRRSTQEAH